MAFFFLVARTLGPIGINVVIVEEHRAEMTIADHPVERGAKISDHAWREPYRLRIEGAIDAPAAFASYQAILALQAAAEPFTMVSGLKVYTNMLIERVSALRDTVYPRVLMFNAELREVIIVDTEASSGSAGSPEPGSTADRAGAVQNRGTVQARQVQSNDLLNSALPR
ncbi:phage baseplate protein [Aquabacter sp. CN5-332]|uniref:phage baseplate protein n=1 Tax=Aquabacter sp. CN5-332 TaxID=3156608 RepID=UPI0032B57DF6